MKQAYHVMKNIYIITGYLKAFTYYVKYFSCFFSSAARGRSLTLLQRLGWQGFRVKRVIIQFWKIWISFPLRMCHWVRHWLTTGSMNTFTSLQARAAGSNRTITVIEFPITFCFRLSSSVTRCGLWYKSSGFSCARPNQLVTEWPTERLSSRWMKKKWHKS